MKAWSVLKFPVSPVWTQVVEEVVETLETDQMLVQGMISSKFIGIFEEQVNEWVRKLGSVDAVLNIFLEVQRTWAYLENIFIGSEDIRAQLPEESKLFDGIDEDLKRILHRTAQIPNVLEVGTCIWLKPLMPGSCASICVFFLCVHVCGVFFCGCIIHSMYACMSVCFVVAYICL